MLNLTKLTSFQSYNIFLRKTDQGRKQILKDLNPNQGLGLRTVKTQPRMFGQDLMILF